MRRSLVPLAVALGALAASPARAQDASAEPRPAAAQAPAGAAAGVDTSRSLFDPAPRQLLIGARVNSIEGDPARWQRYQDMRDGPLLTDVRVAHAWAATGQTLQVTADNVGWRDQRFSGVLERPGLFRITGLWDEIPQFYSVDTRTPYVTAGRGELVLDDATQLAIQRGQANLTAYVPQAGQFDLRERREVGRATVAVSPTVNLDLSSTFTTQRHVGELPWGASFGFGNDVEVALPYNSRANDLSLGAEWSNRRHMLRVAYDGSWFENHDPTLVWDSPLRLDDGASAPGRGRMSLWPSNRAQTVSLGGYTKLARRTQVTGFVSYGVWSNDEPLQPFTINAALPVLPLPRDTADATAHVFSTNLGIVSRPADAWRLSGRIRVYDFDNRTPEGGIPQFVNYDSALATSSTAGPEPFAHSRATFSADATWTGLPAVALGVGYAHNRNGYRFRIFEHSSEDVLTLTADAVALSWGSARAQVEIAGRTGSGLDEAALIRIGEQPALRHFDVANRARTKFTGSFDVLPHEAWVLNVTGGFGRDDYDDSYFGLQEATFRIAGAGLDYQRPNGLGAGGSYNYERYYGLHQSRSASPGAEAEDPLRDWTTDSTERVHYFSIYVTPPRLGSNTEARLSYDFAYARARYVYGLVPGSPLPAPAQLPEAYNKLQELRVDVRRRLSQRMAATVAYAYEPFRVYDFALDRSVVDGIVQPSSLVLGYVYRPYTAHSAVIGLLYFW